MLGMVSQSGQVKSDSLSIRVLYVIVLYYVARSYSTFALVTGREAGFPWSCLSMWLDVKYIVVLE